MSIVDKVMGDGFSGLSLVPCMCFKNESSLERYFQAADIFYIVKVEVSTCSAIAIVLAMVKGSCR